jgi:hypothetical protein
MTDLLHSDILSFLQAHAQGHARAVPRHRLMSYLKANGHAVTDRAMRRAYADIDSLGSCAKGLFWIRDAEDRRIAGKQLHGRAMSELVREKRIKDAAPAGQISLFEEMT